MADVDFQTVKAEEIKFGRNNFLEVALKKAVTQEGENNFIALSRGFFLPDGTKRFRRSLALPIEGDIIDFVTNTLKAYQAEAPKQEKTETQEATEEQTETKVEEAATEQPAAE